MSRPRELNWSSSSITKILAWRSNNCKPSQAVWSGHQGILLDITLKHDAYEPEVPLVAVRSLDRVLWRGGDHGDGTGAKKPMPEFHQRHLKPFPNFSLRTPYGETHFQSFNHPPILKFHHERPRSLMVQSSHDEFPNRTHDLLTNILRRFGSVPTTMRPNNYRGQLLGGHSSLLLALSVCSLLSFPNLALAGELPLDSGGRVDYNILHDRSDELRPAYEPEFGLFERSIIGRQTGNAIPIEKETPAGFTLVPGTPRCYALSREDIQSGSDDDGDSNRRNELRGLRYEEVGVEGSRSRRRRQSGSEVYISATTCLQPDFVKPNADNKEPPQLRLLVAKPGATQCPEWKPESERPGDDDPNSYEEHEFEEGLVFTSVTASEDSPLYVTIYAPETSEDFSGDYDFELVMSMEDWYHRYVGDVEGSKQLLWMDSDSSAALLLTHNLTGAESDTEKILKRDPPFELYVENREYPVFNGIKRSLCGIEKKALVSANKEGNGRAHELVRTSMTTRGGGDLPKQQFYFEGLNSSSKYNAILVQVADASEYDYFIDDEERRRQENLSRRQMTIFEPTEFETLTGNFS